MLFADQRVHRSANLNGGGVGLIAAALEERSDTPLGGFLR